MDVKLDKKDCEILKLIQKDCKLTTKEIARELHTPITTVYAKIKRLEELGVIQGYNAILSAPKLDVGTTAFVFVAYNPHDQKLDQREVAKRIARFPEVLDVHIITGDWDILLKVKVKDVPSVGNFVIDKLRGVDGVDKTQTSFVLTTEKETLNIDFAN